MGGKRGSSDSYGRVVVQLPVTLPGSVTMMRHQAAPPILVLAKSVVYQFAGAGLQQQKEIREPQRRIWMMNSGAICVSIGMTSVERFNEA